MQFTTAGHFSGLFSHSLNIIEPAPWLYIITVLNAKILYIGETVDQGLTLRLSQHFGRYSESTLKQRALEKGFTTLYPPFLVIAARLPCGDEATEVDAQSKKVRLMYESALHQQVISKFVVKQAGWRVIVSVP